MDEVLGATRTAVTVGVEAEIASWESGFHVHEKAQFMLSLRGVGLCEADGGVWLVPPQSALFVPGNTSHRVTAAGKVEGYAVFIDANSTWTLPSTKSANALLRELVIRSSQLPAVYPEGGTESRVVALLMDEIAAAPVSGLHLPMPCDERLRSIFHDPIRNPAQRGTVESWAKRIGMSERSLARVVASETGMSFVRWRQQLNVILALQWMSAGATVERTAFDLGYENVGSFITMFRKTLGKTPARYVADRLQRR